jgi:hypothetical protein
MAVGSDGGVARDANVAGAAYLARAELQLADSRARMAGSLQRPGAISSIRRAPSLSNCVSPLEAAGRAEPSN